MSSKEADAIYELLLKRYKEKGFLKPKEALDSAIESLVQKRRTREEAISELNSSDSPWTYSPPPLIDSEQKKEDEREKAILGQIANLREKIDSLTTLFSRGEITQETYVSGVKKIEDDIKQLRGEHRMPMIERREFSPTNVWGTARHETIEESQYRHRHGSADRTWYLVPFFFGILGGIIAYVAVKNDDSEMADNLLVFSILWTFALVLLGWLFIH